mmetsp:Transcript_19972/g.46877  ORF Transcript_19972/g.46877 Transcript_19972/m.46877 type:complete len:312 (+) Transcript_19972:185-1120(+)
MRTHLSLSSAWLVTSVVVTREDIVAVSAAEVVRVAHCGARCVDQPARAVRRLPHALVRRVEEVARLCAAHAPAATRKLAEQLRPGPTRLAPEDVHNRSRSDRAHRTVRARRCVCARNRCDHRCVRARNCPDRAQIASEPHTSARATALRVCEERRGHPRLVCCEAVQTGRVQPAGTAYKVQDVEIARLRGGRVAALALALALAQALTLAQALAFALTLAQALTLALAFALALAIALAFILATALLALALALTPALADTRVGGGGTGCTLAFGGRSAQGCRSCRWRVSRRGGWRARVERLGVQEAGGHRAEH